jgi:SAM-dependent methyltransferase
VGIDVNEDLLALARAGAGRWPQASFERGDVTRLEYRDAFDVVTAARVLQWLASPESALLAMVGAAKAAGRIVVLDYNHTKARWEPEPPAAYRHFYEAFMAWRADAGMDNELADHLAGMMRAAGLTDVRLSDESEAVSDDDLDFDERIALWPRVIATRGHQLVADGFLTETERVAASEALIEWATHGSVRQTLYLLAATAVK